MADPKLQKRRENDKPITKGESGTKYVGFLEKGIGELILVHKNFFENRNITLITRRGVTVNRMIDRKGARPLLEEIVQDRDEARLIELKLLRIVLL